MKVHGHHGARGRASKRRCHPERGARAAARRARGRQRHARRAAREGARAPARARARSSWARRSSRAGVEVLVHVIAGDPSAEDEEIVRAAAEVEVAVVLVQLWPQDDWTKPFVLSPVRRRVPSRRGLPDSGDRRATRRGDGGLGCARGRPSGHRRPRARRPRAAGGPPLRRDRTCRRSNGSFSAADLARAGAHGRAVAENRGRSVAGRRPHRARRRWRRGSPHRVRASAARARCSARWSRPRWRTPRLPPPAPGPSRRRSSSPSRIFRSASRLRPDLDLGCARDRAHGNCDAEHRAGRGALAARGSRRLVRVSGVDARSDRDALCRARAVGLGATVAAPSRRARASSPPAACGRVIAGRAAGRPKADW